MAIFFEFGTLKHYRIVISVILKGSNRVFFFIFAGRATQRCVFPLIVGVWACGLEVWGLRSVALLSGVKVCGIKVWGRMQK